jgi:hypothetical protein
MMPFIPGFETFLCLALCGSIRDGIVPWVIVADFLLFHLNLIDPQLYTELYEMEPTNDVNKFLACVARKTGKLLKGGKLDEKGAARNVIARFRNGKIGGWPVDSVTPQAFDVRISEEVRARLREFKGGRHSLSEKMDTKFSSQKAGNGTGIMSRAIQNGRNDARRPGGKRAKSETSKTKSGLEAERGKKPKRRRRK